MRWLIAFLALAGMWLLLWPCESTTARKHRLAASMRSGLWHGEQKQICRDRRRACSG